MKCGKRVMVAGACLVGVAALAGCASNRNTKTHAASDESAMQLPKGWTQADMDACTMAGTPGKEHADLMKLAGRWTSKERMWMGPGGEEMQTTGTWQLTPIMDGRYLQLDASGEMPGMGPYKGLGVLGFDNVSRKYVATYVDQMSTGIMHGEGKMSSDAKTLSINYIFNCPITRKKSVFREVLRFDSERAMHVEMFATDPKSGKEYMCMSAELSKNN